MKGLQKTDGTRLSPGRRNGGIPLRANVRGPNAAPGTPAAAGRNTPDGAPRYETSAARVAGWNDPGNTTGWAGVPEWVNRSRLRER